MLLLFLEECDDGRYDGEEEEKHGQNGTKTFCSTWPVRSMGRCQYTRPIPFAP